VRRFALVSAMSAAVASTVPRVVLRMVSFNPSVIAQTGLIYCP
jgi:hypothetical protein